MESNETKLKIEEITNVRVMLGILKEALFLRLSFEINSIQPSLSISLSSIEENNPRDIEAERKLIFSVSQISPDTVSSLNIDCTYSFRVGFPKFSISFQSTCEAKNDEIAIFSLPKNLTYSQLRKTNRLKLQESTFQPILYLENSLASEAALFVWNVSERGLGAKLRFANNTKPPKLGATVCGTIQIGQNEFSIDATIIRIEKKQSLDHGTLPYYEVGLEIRETESLKREYDRSVNRFEVNNVIKLTSVLNDNPYEIRLKDASFLGFAGYLVDSELTKELPLGFKFHLKDTSLSFRLLECRGGLLRFMLEEGTSLDRLFWAKQISRATFKDVQTRTGDGDDLFRLFCEAGAIPTEILSRVTLYNEEFLGPLTSETDESFWIFRWINVERGSQRVRGHISGVRYGDNAWFIGDGAGGSSPETKIEPTFIARYFSAFKDFAKSQSPCPRIFFVWKSGHPYWNDFELFLQANKQTSGFFGSFHIGHTKLPPLINSTISDRVHAVEIKPSEVEMIDAIIEKSKINGVHSLLESMDFSVDRFASPILRTSFHEHGDFVFVRKFFYLRCEDQEYLAVLTKIPFGSSFNQVMSSAFLFDLKTNEKQKLVWADIATKIQALGLAVGITPSSIRRVSYGDRPFQLLPGEQNQVIGFLVHHSLLAFYDKKDRRS